MEPFEPLESRLAMAEMHDDVLRLLEVDVAEGAYIETCWLCYSCFESRVKRTLDKVSKGCCCAKCSAPKNRVGIATRIKCLKRLSRENYSGLSFISSDLLQEIEQWCSKRNALVHDLLSPQTYPTANKSFQDLAVSGSDLVRRMYESVSGFRNKYYELKTVPAFPSSVEDACRLVKYMRKKQRVNEQVVTQDNDGRAER